MLTVLIIESTNTKEATYEVRSSRDMVSYHCTLPFSGYHRQIVAEHQLVFKFCVHVCIMFHLEAGILILIFSPIVIHDIELS